MKNNILKNRIGIIEVSPQIVDDFENDFVLSKTFFSNFFPISIKKYGYSIISTYCGYSKQFREVVEDESIPTYEAIFKSFRKGDVYKLSVKFKEIK